MTEITPATECWNCEAPLPDVAWKADFDAERARADAAEAHVRDHHIEGGCMTCMAMESERDVAEAREAALREACVRRGRINSYCRLCGDVWTAGGPERHVMDDTLEPDCILAQPSPAAGKVLVDAASGVGRIATERRRQVELGYTAGHDADHDPSEFARAAACYALEAATYWPWPENWKPGERRRNYEKAGALMAAALDALRAGEEGAR